MRPIFKVLIALVAILTAFWVGQGIRKSAVVSDEELEAETLKHRKALSDTLTASMEMEVYLLDFEMTDVADAEKNRTWYKRLPSNQFPILPYGFASTILKRKTLSAEEKALLLPSLQQTLSAPHSGGGAACHYPIHGIRIWGEGDLIFQTSFCYQCSNFYMVHSSSEAGWLGLTDPNFQKIMEQLMPIPQAELDRFDAKHPTKQNTSSKLLSPE